LIKSEIEIRRVEKPWVWRVQVSGSCRWYCPR